jgi:2,4-dienoyl-CoA reductase-like NADH-dependent reductase (Old Yellow Enzyme family)
MEEAISNGACDMVGVGRPLCSVPDAINKLLSGELDVLPSIDETLTLGPSMQVLCLQNE